MNVSPVYPENNLDIFSSLHLISPRSNITTFVCCHDIIPKARQDKRPLQFQPFTFVFTDARLKHFYTVHVIVQCLPKCMFNLLEIKPEPGVSQCRWRRWYFLITVVSGMLTEVLSAHG